MIIKLEQHYTDNNGPNKKSPSKESDQLLINQP